MKTPPPGTEPGQGPADLLETGAPPALVEAWEPLGEALEDYLEQRWPDTGGPPIAKVWMEDGERLPLPPSLFFRQADELAEPETLALDLCRGRVLDVGAGAGCHSLILQTRGIDVTALDIAPRAAEVMSQRGVRRVCCGDLYTDCGTERFDTLLLLMNGLGVVGDRQGLARYLGHARRVLADGGQILCDSSDLRWVDDPEELRRGTERERRGRHRGETRQRIEYRGLLGAEFGWLYLGTEDLARLAQKAGFHSQVLFEDDDGVYLARLTLG